MKPFYQKSGITLYNADCRDVAKFVKCDFILTDPPYPDYYADEYGYFPPMFLNDFSCRQLVFWSAKADFPLSFTARHVWDKWRGTASEYEFIYERNGQANFKVFRRQKLNNEIDAQMNQDVLTAHPSQKPIRLLKELINKFIPKGSVVFDPFSGSGSHLKALHVLGYEAIGCEISEKWCDVTVERLAQMSLFTLPNTASTGRGLQPPATQIDFTAESSSPAKVTGKHQPRQ